MYSEVVKFYFKDRYLIWMLVRLLNMYYVVYVYIHLVNFMINLFPENYILAVL